MTLPFARLTIAAAAIASIATSIALPTITETQPLEPLVLDSQNPTRTYAIQIRFVGEPESSPSGMLDVDLDLLAGAGAAQDLRLTLARVGELPETDEQTILVAPGGRHAATLSLGAWITCEPATECVEDYTLTVARTATDAPAIEIAGNVEVEAIHHENETEPMIFIDVTPL